ncbi:MAG: hypothetical protein QOH32_2883 [Bradyrhizobium sp.]|jgi:hypothetical protein|nr:hypothetical protein [Bradyrhizobium sp.]
MGFAADDGFVVQLDFHFYRFGSIPWTVMQLLPRYSM